MNPKCSYLINTNKFGQLPNASSYLTISSRPPFVPAFQPHFGNPEAVRKRSMKSQLDLLQYPNLFRAKRRTNMLVAVPLSPEHFFFEGHLHPIPSSPHYPVWASEHRPLAKCVPWVLQLLLLFIYSFIIRFSH